MLDLELFLKIFFVAFFINLLYELLHSILYKTCLEASLKKYLYLMLKAAIFDGLAVPILYFLSYVILPGYYLIIFLLSGVAFAYGWEIYSSKAKKWEYSKKMPVILGAGLTPVLQLSLTGIISLYIVFNLLK